MRPNAPNVKPSTPAAGGPRKPKGAPQAKPSAETLRDQSDFIKSRLGRRPSASELANGSLSKMLAGMPKGWKKRLK